MNRTVIVILLIGTIFATNGADDGKGDLKKKDNVKYQYLMPMVDVQKIFKDSYNVLFVEKDYGDQPDGVPSEKQKRHDAALVIKATEEGLVFYFNAYKQLIKVRLITPPDTEVAD